VTTGRRLDLSQLAGLPAKILRPAYDPVAVTIGVVHFGPGAFHRAHQAAYFDALLGSDPAWGICGVSLHSHGVRDALQPQDGLYTLARLDAEIDFRVIGAVREILVAPENPAAVLARLAAASTRLVTLTVTEKGYCLRNGELDTDHPDIVHDLAHPDTPRSVIGYLVAGLQRRKTAELDPYVTISCDNLVDNGHRLAAAVMAFAALRDPALARWIGETADFPCSMIDSITPATDDALRTRVAVGLGVEDAWPIQREAFVQWVVERPRHAVLPDLASVGVELTDDVGLFDRVKLRLLNGPHSSLAYLGALLGFETVYEAMGDAALAGFIERLMRTAILPTVVAPPNFDLSSYCDAVLQRFRNPAIRHLLSQIAWDGSQKLPFRLFGTLADRRAQGGDVDTLCLAIAAWMHFVRRAAVDGRTIVDPRADALQAIGQACTLEPAGDVAHFCALDHFLPDALLADQICIAALQRAYAALGDASPAAIHTAIHTTVHAAL